MPLVDAAGNLVPAVDNQGVISSLPARTGFAVLLKEGYLTTWVVFSEPAWRRYAFVEDAPGSGDWRNLPMQDLIPKEDDCWLGWDPTKNRHADATCAILADKPSKDVSLANQGTAKNNSDNHGKRGQGVMYNDGHVKWQTTPKPDCYDGPGVPGYDDPDIYTGAPGYEKSMTDAKIIR
jgi:hypothetical protein